MHFSIKNDKFQLLIFYLSMSIERKEIITALRNIVTLRNHKYDLFNLKRAINTYIDYITINVPYELGHEMNEELYNVYYETRRGDGTNTKIVYKNCILSLIKVIKSLVQTHTLLMN